MIPIILFLLYSLNLLTGFHSDLSSYPTKSAFSRFEDNNYQNKTLYIIHPNDIHTIVSTFGGSRKNHAINLASIDVTLNSHVIYRGDSIYALCSLDENGMALSWDSIEVVCYFNLYYHSNIITKANCTIGKRDKRCVSTIYPDPLSMMIGTDYISLNLNYHVEVYNSTNLRVPLDISKTLIYRTGNLSTVYSINLPRYSNMSLGQYNTMTIQNYADTQEFYSSLHLEESTESLYFEMNLPDGVEFIEMSPSKGTQWLCDVQKVAHNTYDLKIERNITNHAKWEIFQLEIKLELSTKLGYRRREIILTNIRVKSDHGVHEEEKLVFTTPRLAAQPNSMYIFTQFQGADVIQLPWESVRQEAKPRKLNVLGYIPSYGRLMDLNKKIYCRIARNKIGSSKDFMQLNTEDMANPCPQEMRKASDEVEYPLPQMPQGLNKDDAYGTGVEFAEQIVLSLGPIEYNVVPDPVFGFSDNSDWSWRIWRGPYQRIWRVDQVEVIVEKEKLSRINNWSYPSKDSEAKCLPRYEHSRIFVRGLIYLTRLFNGGHISLTGQDSRVPIDLTAFLTRDAVRLESLEKDKQMVGQIYWPSNSNGPMLVGLKAGRGKVHLVGADHSVLSSRTVLVTNKEPKNVVSMEVLCGNPQLTLSGKLEEQGILIEADISYSQNMFTLANITNFNYPIVQKLTLDPVNELLRPILHSHREKNALREVYHQGSQVDRAGDSPTPALNDSCDVNKVLVFLNFDDKTKMSLSLSPEGQSRLTARMENDYRLVWDPSVYIEEDEKTEDDIMPQVRLTDLEVWSSSEECSKSLVSLQGQTSQTLATPIAAMDDPFERALLASKWTDPGTTTQALYKKPIDRSTYFKSLLLTFENGAQHQNMKQDLTIGKESFDNRIIYGIIAAILFIVGVLMLIQVRTIIKYKKRKNLCGAASSIVNGSSMTDQKMQRQTYSDLAQSPLVQNTLATNRGRMSCCSTGSSQAMNQQPLFISPQSMQNNQFCGQMSPSPAKMNQEAFHQNICSHSNSCMGTPLMLNNNVNGSDIAKSLQLNGHMNHNLSNTSTVPTVSPMLSSMQNQTSPDCNVQNCMWTSQMQGCLPHQPLQNNKTNQTFTTNNRYNIYGMGSISSASDLNGGGSNPGSNILSKPYDGSFRGASPLSRNNNASPLTGNWNFTQLLPYNLPENCEGSHNGKSNEGIGGYNTSGLGSVGTCSDEGIGTASSPQHRYNQDVIITNNNSLDSSNCAWSNFGPNKMLQRNSNSAVNEERFYQSQDTKYPPPMGCLASIKSTSNGRNSLIKNSATLKNEMTEFPTAILPPVQLSSETSQNSHYGPKSFIHPSDSSDVIISMMGDVFEYETDTSRTNSISKMDNLPIPTNL